MNRAQRRAASSNFRRLPIYAERQCGTCTACCTTLGVSALGKADGQPCQHERVGHGCGIYGHRPTECKEFLCGWRVGFQRKEETPEKVGYILYAPDPRYLATRDVIEGSGAGYNDRKRIEEIAMSLGVGIGICFVMTDVRASEMKAAGAWGEDVPTGERTTIFVGPMNGQRNAIDAQLAFRTTP